jgi:flagellin
MMQRMRDLSVQAASDTNDQSDRANINLELGQLQQEIDSISGTTKFNGQTLLNGSLTSLQKSGSAGYAASSVELTAGATLSTTTNASVASIDVSGSASGLGYTFSADSSGNITAAQVDALGQKTGQSQIIAATDLAAGETETLNFSKFGIKVNLDNTSKTSVTASDIASAFTGSNALSIDTGVASGAAILQTGANQGEQTSVSFVDTRLSGSTSTVMKALNTALNNFSSSVAGTDTTVSRTDAGALITALDNALDYVSSSRATLGAAQNRLQDTISSLGTTSENLSASNSRIVDVDVATESSKMAKEQVLEQAGVSVLAQANQIPQLALKLLQ